MRDRRTLLIVVTLVALAFWGGISWERGDCSLEWPANPDQFGNILQCANEGSTASVTNQPAR